MLSRGLNGKRHRRAAHGMDHMLPQSQLSLLGSADARSPWTSREKQRPKEAGVQSSLSWLRDASGVSQPGPSHFLETRRCSSGLRAFEERQSPTQANKHPDSGADAW